MAHRYLSPLLKKSSFCLCLLWLLLVNVNGQKIQYSRQSAIINFPDATQLISDIGGYHHLVSLTYKKKPLINIFDQQLQLVSTKEIPIKIPEDSDIKFLAFRNYYYMYIQERRGVHYELWRMDEKGNANSLTDEFKKLMQSQFKKGVASFQLINKNNDLYIITHTYYGQLEKIETTVVKADEMMNAVSKQTTLYDFNAAAETLQQVMLLNDKQLLVLKSSKNFIYNNMLELMKVPLDSGLLVSTTFSSTGSYYSEPSVTYNNTDSSVTLCSMVKSNTSSRSENIVMISQLDNGLKEKVPLSLLKHQFKNNPLASFLLVQAKEPLWVGYMNRGPRFFPGYARAGSFNSREEVVNTFTINNRYDPYSRGGYDESSSIRFTMLNNQLKPANDSVIVNKKSSYGIQPQLYAKFVVNRKCYLFFNQKFTANRRGILMVYGNDDKQIEITDVRVNDRYDYLLSQLQVIPGRSVLLPYTHKREAGLIKLTWD